MRSARLASYPISNMLVDSIQNPSYQKLDGKSIFFSKSVGSKNVAFIGRPPLDRQQFSSDMTRCSSLSLAAGHELCIPIESNPEVRF